jgi:hypothetical protein
MRFQVSHIYKTTDKIIILYNLMFALSGRKREDKSYRLNGFKLKCNLEQERDLYIVRCTPIARQRVGKQVPAKTDSW